MASLLTSLSLGRLLRRAQECGPGDVIKPLPALEQLCPNSLPNHAAKRRANDSKEDGRVPVRTPVESSCVLRGDVHIFMSPCAPVSVPSEGAHEPLQACLVPDAHSSHGSLSVPQTLPSRLGAALSRCLLSPASTPLSGSVRP